MDDKLIEDFDVDFMNEILGPSELQMADNMMHDLMGDLNTENHNQPQLINQTEQNWVNNCSQQPIECQTNFTIQNENFQQFQSYQTNQMSTNILLQSPISNSNVLITNQIINDSQINYYSTKPSIDQSYENNPILPVNHINHSLNHSSLVVMSNTNQLDLSLNNIEPQNIFNINSQNKTINDNDSNNNNNKKVRKNLKDILKDENNANISSLNSNINTILNNNPNRNDLITVSPVLSPAQNFPMPLTPPSPPNKQLQNQKFLNQSNISLSHLIDQNMITDPIYQQNIRLVTDVVMPINSFQSNNLTEQSCIQHNPTVLNSNDTKLTLIQSQNSKKEDPKQLISEDPKSKQQSKTKSRTQKENQTKPDPIKMLDSQDIVIKKSKVPKRTSHNAIEKKYRLSINDKIVELKNRVAGPNAKLQKSGILKKALEHINNIENQNKKLIEENRILRSALQTISLNSNNLTVIQSVLQTVNLNKLVEKSTIDTNMPNTPPSSSSSSDGDSLFSMSDTDSSLSQPQTPIDTLKEECKKKSKSPSFEGENKPTRTYNKRVKKEAMMDSSRIMLCMFVMSVLFFNPFNLIISSSSPYSILQNSGKNSYGQYQSIKLNSRVLNSYDDASFVDSAYNSTENRKSAYYFDFSFLLSWSLNTILILFCLVRIYISGEAYIDLNSKNDELIWLNYQRASKNFHLKNYEEAFNYCEKGLKELGQIVPKTKFQFLIGILWQINRLIFNKLYIGILFSKFGIWLYGLKSLKMYKLISLFYYEIHKFTYLKMKSENDFIPKLTDSSSSSSFKSYFFKNTTSYSFLSSIYYILTMYNMCEIYTKLDQSKSELNLRDEYNLCEFYFSIILYLKFYIPTRISKPIIEYLIKKKLLNEIDIELQYEEDEREKNGEVKKCKFKNLKNLLHKNIFVHFVINLEDYTLFNNENRFNSSLNTTFDEKNLSSIQKKQITLDLILFKRRMFSSPFLYDSDEKFDANGKITNYDIISNPTNPIACDFILSKFKDFTLLKMTNHIINQSGTITVDRVLNPFSQNCPTFDECLSNTSKNPLDLDEEQKELADVDQIKFEKLQAIYKNNLEYFFSSNSDDKSNKIQQETTYILIEFLNMLNKWKLRKFDYKTSDTNELKNPKKSHFIDSIINALKAYENIFTTPEKSLEFCLKSVTSLKQFDSINNHSHLVEKFELLIYDWILSMQTHLWSKHKIFKLDLYNQSLQSFKKVTLNYPELNFKVKMYETILKFTANRNPVNLLNTNTKQHMISKCNQEAFYSMNSILKKFHLHFLE